MRTSRASRDPAVASIDVCVGIVASARTGPREADTSLRPALMRIADALLLAHTGLSLRDHPAPQRVLGEELFRFIDPRRGIRDHSDGDGLTGAEVDRLLRPLEEIAWR